MAADPGLVEYWKAGRASEERYDYFLMALVTAAIAFAVQKTSGIRPDWSMLWLLGAVLSWGGSLFAGIRRQENLEIAYTSYYKILAGHTTGEENKNTLKERYPKANQRADLWKKVQAYGLLGGAVLFITWHIFAMAAIGSTTERRMTMEKRPGEASVHYGDMQGEAAADYSDKPSHFVEWAEQLGVPGSGHIVGVRIYGGTGGVHGTESVDVTFQVYEHDWSVDAINEALQESNGKLVVKEYTKTGVPIADFVQCFKILEIGLINSAIRARKVVVEEEIELQ